MATSFPCPHCRVVPACCGNCTKSGECRSHCAIPAYECWGACEEERDLAEDAEQEREERP